MEIIDITAMDILDPILQMKPLRFLAIIITLSLLNLLLICLLDIILITIIIITNNNSINSSSHMLMLIMVSMERIFSRNMVVTISTIIMVEILSLEKEREALSRKLILYSMTSRRRDMMAPMDRNVSGLKRLLLLANQ